MQRDIHPFFLELAAVPAVVSLSHATTSFELE
jgi:hypothetical protein